jgi:hypothetical protein
MKQNPAGDFLIPPLQDLRQMRVPAEHCIDRMVCISGGGSGYLYDGFVLSFLSDESVSQG